MYICIRQLHKVQSLLFRRTSGSPPSLPKPTSWSVCWTLHPFHFLLESQSYLLAAAVAAATQIVNLSKSLTTGIEVGSKPSLDFLLASTRFDRQEEGWIMQQHYICSGCIPQKSGAISKKTCKGLRLLLRRKNDTISTSSNNANISVGHHRCCHHCFVAHAKKTQLSLQLLPLFHRYSSDAAAVAALRLLLPFDQNALSASSGSERERARKSGKGEEKE